ncbi:MAG: aldo/keto reductase [Pseudomonadota bacterium]
MTIPRFSLGALSPAQVLVGLWQVADMERAGPLDPDVAASHLAAYADHGLDTFDMADHYGSAEIIAGRAAALRPGKTLSFTKWCPEPGPMTAEVVRAGVSERLARLGVERVDLLQFHWWSFEHPAWLDALHHLKTLRAEGVIGEIGVTNFDAAHLRVALADGVPLVSNQVSCSLIDRRARGDLKAVADAFGVKLLAYGTLCGGFLTDKWHGAAAPADIPDWSGMKYRRFIDAGGGWDALQHVLNAAATVAERHGASIANVATRWVLDLPHVGGIIIGARLGEREHRGDTARLSELHLTDADRATLEDAFTALTPIPGDCGDEYRTPPFLTASGDLSHHLESLPSAYHAEPVPGRPQRLRVSSGSVWEPIAGYSRAIRVGSRVLVSGTTATHGSEHVVAPDDAGAQTTYILDKILGALRALGAGPEDVVRTRVLLRDIADWEPASRAHGRVFGDVRPANTLLAVGDLVGDYRVEIEAEAVIDEA